jgi:nitroreductase
MGNAEGAATERAAGHAQVLLGHAQYLIASAGRAPSVHNSQPWRFIADADSIELWCALAHGLAAGASRPPQCPATHPVTKERTLGLTGWRTERR